MTSRHREESAGKCRVNPSTDSLQRVTPMISSTSKPLHHPSCSLFNITTAYSIPPCHHNTFISLGQPCGYI
ncbi:hypothetical protein EX30DRAFT_134346 [Ascodesmis nigricans]|uniref:Uncharacterized protein n=1 Tax=Ascodesmis nigricans TaxID=341454 RepID=A0A4S2MNU8_9PEZI|nr:hypothetical protein EX30DRAFT_134346 [Ascodesmis nigricans]